MSLPTYEEAYARALNKAPFSNSDEGYAWMAAWCDRCINDKSEGCPLVMVAVMDRTPIEWLDQKRAGCDGPLVDRFHCIYFRNEDDPGPDEPTPIPDPPGQLTLCPRDQFERPARMFADTKPVEVHA